MEPVTHFLTGACLGRSGLNRLTARATLVATLAAEAPDIDVVMSHFGPVVGLATHRGLTHTLIAMPVMAALVVALVIGLEKALDKAIAALGRRNPHWQSFLQRSRPANPSSNPSTSPSTNPPTSPSTSPQPIRWGWLFLTACLAHLSHLVLDWTNNYGLRPFAPWGKKWLEGDLVFIAEPALWLLLVTALVIPGLLGLADREIGARRVAFRGRGWAIFALVGMVLLWCWRWAEHAHGIQLVESANLTTEPVSRVALMPYPWNPWRWHALVETPTAWITAEVDTARDEVVSDPQLNRLPKPAPTPAVAVARSSQLGRVYLDWSQWPVVRDVGPMAAPGTDPAAEPGPESGTGSGPTAATGPQSWTTVSFHDLRFAMNLLPGSISAADTTSLRGQVAHAPLSGWVYVVNSREEAGMFMNGREQH